MLNLWHGCDIEITSYKKINKTMKWKNLKKINKKTLENARVNSTNLQLEIWNQDNPIEKKMIKIMKPKA